MLFSAYRKDDFADPEGFVVQLGVVLEKYPEWVVRYVTSPETGIQRRQTFPPSIAEVVKACEELYSPTRFSEEWEARARRQAEERAALPNPPRYSAQTITWAKAEELMQGKKIKIIGVFDPDRKIPYRG